MYQYRITKFNAKSNLRVDMLQNKMYHALCLARKAATEERHQRGRGHAALLAVTLAVPLAVAHFLELGEEAAVEILVVVAALVCVIPAAAFNAVIVSAAAAAACNAAGVAFFPSKNSITSLQKPSFLFTLSQEKRCCGSSSEKTLKSTDKPTKEVSAPLQPDEWANCLSLAICCKRVLSDVNSAALCCSLFSVRWTVGKSC